MFCIGFLFAQRPSKSVHDKVEIMKLALLSSRRGFRPETQNASSSVNSDRLYPDPGRPLYLAFTANVSLTTIMTITIYLALQSYNA